MQTSVRPKPLSRSHTTNKGRGADPQDAAGKSIRKDQACRRGGRGGARTARGSGGGRSCHSASGPACDRPGGFQETLGALAWSVAWAEPAEIDAMNILAATMLAMRRAILSLPIMPALVQVDGNRLPDLKFGAMQPVGEAVVGGDDRIAAISAASILAKTDRDQRMLDLDRLYPCYEFARHKGYGTRVHIARLEEFGPCCEHRFSFAPVRVAS